MSKKKKLRWLREEVLSPLWGGNFRLRFYPEDADGDDDAGGDDDDDADDGRDDKLEAYLKQMEDARRKDAEEAARKAKADAAKAAELSEKEKLAKLKKEADLKKKLTGSSKDIDLDQLTNKELLDILAEAVDESVAARLEGEKSALTKLLEQQSENIDSIKKYLIQREAAQGVEDARREFKDFDNYREDMQKIYERYPSMDIKDAYLLAKSQKASRTPPQKEVETEQPIDLLTRAKRAQEAFDKAKKPKKSDDEPVIRTSRDFRSIVMSAADKILSSRGVKD